MKKLLLFLMLLTLMAPSSAFSWGSLGHDASVLIAEKHLTRKAKKNLAKYLENRPLVYYASWMDYMGYVTKSGYSNDWFDHCVPVDKAFEYDEGGTREQFTAANDRFRRNCYTLVKDRYGWYDIRRYLWMNKARRWSNYCELFGWSGWTKPEGVADE